MLYEWIKSMVLVRDDLLLTSERGRVFKLYIPTRSARRAKKIPHTVDTSVPETKPEEAWLSTTEVIRIAKQAAERQGADLRRYKEPEAHYELARKDKSWWVFFDGRVAMPGNHFSVSVDDQTGETRFFGGR